MWKVIVDLSIAGNAEVSTSLLQDSARQSNNYNSQYIGCTSQDIIALHAYVRDVQI